MVILQLIIANVVIAAANLLMLLNMVNYIKKNKCRGEKMSLIDLIHEQISSILTPEMLKTIAEKEFQSYM